MSTSVKVNGSVSQGQNVPECPILEGFKTLLGEMNLAAQSREFTNLSFSEFYGVETLWNSWAKFSESLGFSKLSHKNSLKFFLAALRSNSAAKSLVLLTEAKKNIEGLAVKLNR